MLGGFLLTYSPFGVENFAIRCLQDKQEGILYTVSLLPSLQLMVFTDNITLIQIWAICNLTKIQAALSDKDLVVD